MIVAKARKNLWQSINRRTCLLEHSHRSTISQVIHMQILGGLTVVTRHTLSPHTLYLVASNQKRKKRWKFHQLSHMWRTRKRVNHTDNWTTISAILRNYLITFPYGSQNVWMNLETLGDHNVMTPKWDATILIKCGANVYIRFHWLRCFCHGKFL